VKAEKKMIILGDMLELGSETRAAHAAVVDRLMNLEGIEVVLVGPRFTEAAEGKKIRSFFSTDETVKWLASEHLQCHYIMVKGSRGMMLEKLYPLL